jgi:hypothetical protein
LLPIKVLQELFLNILNMKISAHIIFSLIGIAGCYAADIKNDKPLYAIAQIPAPVLNTPDFSFVFGGQDGRTLHFDKTGLIREVELIALPQTVFKIEEQIKKNNALIYKVTTEDYPYPTEKGYFIDSRFVQTSKSKPPQRKKILPLKNKIIENLLSAQGSIYVWGGNFKDGILQMLLFYTPYSSLSNDLKTYWTLKGVDCSGLLYQATNGFTPRNASSLVSFGLPVQIAGLNAKQIVQKVEPLDIIVWKEHVAIILDKDRLIESRHHYDDNWNGNKGGVRVENLEEVLEKFLKQRVPVDNYEDNVEAGKPKLVIRRWYDVKSKKDR